MKTQYFLVLLAVVVSVPLIAAACGSYTLVPKKIQEQAFWATLNDPAWEFRWKDSPRDQTPRVFWDSTVEMDVTSRATAWFNQSRETGALLLATPDISIAGFSQNPFTTEGDEWIVREIARQGGGVARQELGITFDPATVPLKLEESATAQTRLGLIMAGSRFLAQSPQGDGYVTVLRETHQNDVLVLLTIAQTLSASRAADNVASRITHPAAEPVIATSNWQTLAEKWARYYSVDARLVKAVVEVEGAENTPGDYDSNRIPHAFGYGQVWPLCHQQNTQKAILDATGAQINVTLIDPIGTPPCPNARIGRNDEQVLGQALLQNDDSSMAVAALVVRDIWLSIGSPMNLADYSTYERFAKRYVGPSISQQDLQRRWQIWQKYLP